MSSVTFSRSLTRFRFHPFLLFVVRLGASRIVGISVAGVGKFAAVDGVGILVLGCSCIDGSGVLFLVFRRWIRGAVQMASGAVGSADVVGVTPTLEFGIGLTLEFDAGSILVQGGTSSSRSGVHLFRPGVWCSERTRVSERKILQWFIFSIALTGTISLDISRRSVAVMIVWSSSEIDGTRACVGNNLYVPLLV